MKKIKRILSNSIFISLSFFIPAFIIAIAYVIFGMYPFGDKSVLIMDMSDQYVEFFAGLRNIFMDGGSLFYSWGKTLGGGFLGIFAYYLSSPFSFIVLLFNESSITEALLFINILKIGLAGL